jgi:hypothetical protein
MKKSKLERGLVQIYTERVREKPLLLWVWP